MHHLRAYFVLLATTFVTAVLATPTNALIRRDRGNASLTDAVDAFNVTNSAVQKLNVEIQNLSSTASEPEVSIFLEDFSTVATSMNAVVNVVNALPQLGEDESENFLTENVIPLLQSVNGTANGITQQANTIFGLDLFQFNVVVASLDNMVLGFTGVESSIVGVFPSDEAILHQLASVHSSVYNNLQNLLTILGN